MPELTSILWQKNFTPILMPGRWIRIEPISIWGFYVLPRSATPEFLPPSIVNIATTTTSLGAAADTGELSGRTVKMTNWDVQGGSLAHYRLWAVDPLVAFKIFQPQARAKLDAKNISLTFDKRLTDYALKEGQLNLLPEVFALEDQTQLFVQGFNMDADAATNEARIGAVGWRYPLIKINHRALGPDGKPLYPPPNRIPAVTIHIGNKQ
jgi:hypothetical protein